MSWHEEPPIPGPGRLTFRAAGVEQVGLYRGGYPLSYLSLDDADALLRSLEFALWRAGRAKRYASVNAPDCDGTGHDCRPPQKAQVPDADYGDGD